MWYGVQRWSSLKQDGLMLTTQMKECGFEVSRIAPCVYWHPTREVWTIVHVDDFFCVGPRVELEAVYGALSNRFLLKRKVLGPNADESAQVDFLGRCVSWTESGIECVQSGSDGESKNDQEGEESPPTGEQRLKRFRGTAALLNYIAQDRMDLSFAAEETARVMSKPVVKDELKAKRAIRILKGHPLLVALYEWQERGKPLCGYTDSDWGGCTRSRRSTSGGIVMWGRACLTHWSRTQASVALSSGEAELNGILQCVCEMLCIKHVLEEFSQAVTLDLVTDSSAAFGASLRHGVGR
eukprot:6492157-Amphidinium_carterae.3